jgi:hypothetical protein
MPRRAAHEDSLLAAELARAFDENVGLREPYKRAVALSLGAKACPPEQFWRELETIVGTFVSLQRHHIAKVPRRQREYWQSIASRADDLARALRPLRRQILWGQRLDLQQTLHALWEVKDWADAHVLGYDTITAAFQHHRHPHRWYLYRSLIDLWTGQLGGELTYTTAADGMPGGPLIRFVEACANPLLAAPLTARAIRKIIDQARIDPLVV